MALNSTTLGSGVTVNDVSVVVASAVGFAAGLPFRIDSEWCQVAKGYVSGTTIPCSRGVDGSATAAHKSGANVTVGLASDFQTPLPTAVVTSPLSPVLPIYSYSASGAIPPIAGIHVLNGTSVLAMTLTNPTKDQDGQFLILIANGKAAHTVTYAAGFGAGGGGTDVATFAATGQGGVIAIAMNGSWVAMGAGAVPAIA